MGSGAMNGKTKLELGLFEAVIGGKGVLRTSWRCVLVSFTIDE